MATTHFEDRLLDAVYDVEMAAVDTVRRITHQMMETVPPTMADLTKMADACYDFTGRMLELQRDAARRVAAEVRETDVSTPTVQRVTRTRKPTRKPATAKAAA